MSIFICNNCNQYLDSDEIDTEVNPSDETELLCQECFNDILESNGSVEIAKPIINDHISIIDNKGNKILGTRG